MGVALNISWVGVDLNISMGPPLSMSAGALNLCSSAEVGVALKISAVLIMSALEDEGVARAICSAVGAARKISAEGVADLMYSVAEC